MFEIGTRVRIGCYFVAFDGNAEGSIGTVIGSRVSTKGNGNFYTVRLGDDMWSPAYEFAESELLAL